jgi:hypothetical protein
MARPISMATVALATAATSIILPQLGSRPPATGQAIGTGPGIRIVRPVDPQPLKLEWNKDNSFGVRLHLRNDGDVIRAVPTASVQVIAQDRRGKTLSVNGVIKLKQESPNQQERCEVKSHSDSICYLSLGPFPKADLPAVGFVSIENGPLSQIYFPEAPTWWALEGWIFVISLIVAVLLVSITAFRLKRACIGLRRVMGSSMWSFQGSWAANAAIASGLLGTIIGLFVFPEHPRYMPKFPTRYCKACSPLCWHWLLLSTACSGETHKSL